MIQLNNITTGYKNHTLLKNFSYTFKDNTIYGILGESGCGKSTLLKAIAGLNLPLEGQIFIDNNLLKKADKNEVYMMHQNYTSFDWLTCLDNILIIERIRHKRITPEVRDKALLWLDKVGLKDSANKYPKQLSGGMRQRLALARTLYIKPSIILMDEPLSALDERTRAQMQQLILDVHQETHNIVIMVTHSIEEAQKMCDVVINL